MVSFYDNNGEIASFDCYSTLKAVLNFIKLFQIVSKLNRSPNKCAFLYHSTNINNHRTLFSNKWRYTIEVYQMSQKNYRMTKPKLIALIF